MHSTAHDETQSERLARLHEDLLAAVAELVDSAAWRRMLQTAAKFSTYSPSNVLLIARQRPDATRVAGIRTWNRLGRHVLKGEHGIAILAPCAYPTRQDPDGQPAPATTPAPTSTPEATPVDASDAQALRGFRIVYVFDISQTDGKPLADQAPTTLAGEAPTALWEHLAAQVADAGMRLEIDECPPGVNGYTDPHARTVRISTSLAPAQAAKTLAHELGHIRAEHLTRFPDYGRDRHCRGLAEVEAESIAYLVTAEAGLDSLPYTVPYIAHWSAGDLQTLRTSASTVIRTAQTICRDLHGSDRADDSAVTSRVSGAIARPRSTPTRSPHTSQETRAASL